MELQELSIAQVHRGLLKKEFSALELAKDFLDRIEEKNKKIFAFLTVTPDLALSQAKFIDDLIAQGREIGILAGIPTAIKDNISVEDIRCTAGSKILENYIACYDATCVKKLKNEGAVILGKTNMDEFAMGSSGERSAFGPTRNPNDLNRVPGGSSSGSTAAVAAKFCSYALGSDTGGSIRLPASFCGVVGLKPTYGAVSRYGLIAMASSLDQIGPITKTVEDAKIVFDAIKGKDELDSTSVELNLKSEILNLKSLKIGVPKEYFVKGTDKDVEEIVKKAIKKFKDAGAKIEEISLPHTEYALAVYYIIMPSEVSANLARYDGIKYGISMNSEQRTMNKTQETVKTLLDVYLKTREEGFGEEVRRRIMLGTYALSSGYYEAYYVRAQKVRSLIKEDFEKAFKEVDVILTPVAPTPAFKLNEKITDPLTMYLSDIFTVSANLTGLPAISVPAGKTGPSAGEVGNLPVGLQIIGRPFNENMLFETGKIFEQICS